MNAEELIVLQYELVKQKSQHLKTAKENYQKCVKLKRENSTCFQKLTAELQEAGKRLDPDQFDDAVKSNCCKFCQTGWGESKSIKEIKKRLKGLKQTMHALARRLLNEKNSAQHFTSADSQGMAVVPN